MVVIDLNADLGEGDGPWRLEPPADDALLALVTSANVAAGYHGGDAATMAATCAAALARGVAVGAHPSYDDRAGFGRRPVDVDPDVLRAQIAHQIGGLVGVARSVGAHVTHVKPHGALYHAAAYDEEHARAVVEAVVAVDPTLAVLGMPGSRVLALAADAGLRPVVEAFVDRGYRADGSLVPRTAPGALVTDPAVAAERAVRLAVDGVVVAVDGTPVHLRPDSLCVHSDTPGAAALAAAVRDALLDAGVVVRPFSPADPARPAGPGDPARPVSPADPARPAGDAGRTPPAGPAGPAAS